MPMCDIPQPEVIAVADDLRLRAFDGEFLFAFDWYQDVETVWLVDGVKVPYTMEKLERMYRYLDKQGELYFIEVLEDDHWEPVGDVAFWQGDMPIVIGDAAYRGRGIGKQVIGTLIQRGRELGFKRLCVNEIYTYNAASRACFASMGFREYEKTEDGSSFQLEL